MKLALNGVVVALSMTLVGFLGGCGPQNLNDQAYLAQLDAQGLDQDGVMSKDDQGKEDDDGNKDDAASAPSDSQGPMAAPATVVKLADRNVIAPSIVERQPTTVLTSGEQRNYRQDTHYWRKVYRPHATVTNHTINNVLERRHIYHTHVVNQPSTCTRVFRTGHSFDTREVTPTTEETMPTVGCPGPSPCAGRFIGGYYNGFRGYGQGYWLRRGF